MNMKKEFATTLLFEEITKMKIKMPKLLDGRYILDDSFRKVITYATPFKNDSYWFIDTPSLPVSVAEKKRALEITEDFLFQWSLIEAAESGDKAKEIDNSLKDFLSPHANE